MAHKNANGPQVSKANLPSKYCLTCARPFVWRKKWQRDWNNVLYCSARCKTRVKRESLNHPMR